MPWNRSLIGDHLGCLPPHRRQDMRSGRPRTLSRPCQLDNSPQTASLMRPRRHSRPPGSLRIDERKSAMATNIEHIAHPGRLRIFVVLCVFTCAVAACGVPANSEPGQNPPLPTSSPSPDVTTSATGTNDEKCRETPSSESVEPGDSSSAAPTASSCGPRATPLTEDQMRSATPAPMPLQPSAGSSGSP